MVTINQTAPIAQESPQEAQECTREAWEANDCERCKRLIEPDATLCESCQNGEPVGPHKFAPEVPGWLMVQACQDFQRWPLVAAIVRTYASYKELDLRTWVARDLIARSERTGLSIEELIAAILAT